MALPAFAVDVLVLDTMTGSTGIGRAGTTGAGGRATIGQGFNLTTPEGVDPENIGISRIEFQLRTGDVAVSYTGLQVRIQFYDNNVGSETDLFTEPAGPAGGYVFSLTPSLLGRADLNLGVNQAYNLGFDLPTLAFLDSTINGVAINFQGDQGNGFFSSPTALTAAVRRGGPFAAGSSIIPGTGGGYFRDTTGRDDLNFRREGDTFVGGGTASNDALYVRLFAEAPAVMVPEANTVALLAFGAALPVAGLIRRRRK